MGGVAHAFLQQAKLALGVIDKRPGTGTANTALVYHARRLMSLHEGDLPYAVRWLLVCLHSIPYRTCVACVDGIAAHVAALVRPAVCGVAKAIFTCCIAGRSLSINYK